VAPGQRVQDFGPARKHPGALARRHDHDVQRHAAIHLASAHVPVVDYRVAAAAGRDRAGRLQHDEAGLQPGQRLRLHWVDRYVELDDAQSLRVRTALDEWFAWHRRTQLPDYADLLARAQSELAADASSERMCAWSREVRARIDTAVERAIPSPPRWR
jgi:hypothetical protein